jgi:hypothetical protein
MKKTQIQLHRGILSKTRYIKMEQAQNIIGYYKTPFMTYYPVCNKNDTTGVTYGTGTAYTSRAHEFIPGF